MNIYDDFNKKEEVKSKEKQKDEFHKALDNLAINKIDSKELAQIIRELDLFLNRMPPCGGVQ